MGRPTSWRPRQVSRRPSSQSRAEWRCLYGTITRPRVCTWRARIVLWVYHEWRRRCTGWQRPSASNALPSTSTGNGKRFEYQLSRNLQLSLTRRVIHPVHTTRNTRIVRGAQRAQRPPGPEGFRTGRIRSTQQKAAKSTLSIHLLPSSWYVIESTVHVVPTHSLARCFCRPAVRSFARRCSSYRTSRSWCRRPS